jgi:hypothetical protein
MRPFHQQLGYILNDTMHHPPVTFLNELTGAKITASSVVRLLGMFLAPFCLNSI